MAQLEAGQLADAIETLAMMEDEQNRAESLIRIVKLQERAGDTRAARSTLRQRCVV